MCLFFSGFAGGDPKPQHHQVRVLPIQKLEGEGGSWRGGSSPDQPGGKKWTRKKVMRGRGYRSKNHHFINKRPNDEAAGPEEVEEKPKAFRLWEDGPNFDTDMRQDVVALEGKNAYLTCRVFDLGNHTVRFNL